MKIGILTVPFNNNYGGFLQAYALKTVLERLGHETVFINRKRNKRQIPLWKKIIAFPFIKFKEYRSQKYLKKKSIHTDKFKLCYLSPITPEYYTHKALKKCLKLGIEAFVVGSDQVWRYKYAKKSIDDFFFSFLEELDVPRFSYAASFGTDENEYPKSVQEKCQQLLKNFKTISVRESSGKNLLVKNFSISPELVKVVLDPTLLLNYKDYEQLCLNYSSQKGTYLCSYILDYSFEKEKMIIDIAKSFAIPIIKLKSQTNNLRKNEVVEPVEKWLSSIANSSFVITDSFHGTVFSIIFNKPFLVIGNGVRGNARFQSLLTLFNLQSRCINDIQDFNKSILSSSIDWDEVNSKINIYRKDSLEFIKKSLILCKHK